MIEITYEGFVKFFLEPSFGGQRGLSSYIQSISQTISE